MRQVEEFVVEDAKFEGQKNSGTALELIETTAQIVNSTFLSNRKGSYRGCIFFHEYGCGFHGFIGGAIIATNSTVEINQSRFEDNGADFGGAIFVEQDSIINMSGNQFVSNSATDWGGVQYSISSTITIEASEFHDNYADIGGVLYSDSSTITIEGSEFHDNYASEGGGVLYSISSTITIGGNEFHDNYADEGGVLYSNSSTITIGGSEFHDNYADEGGVLYSNSSTITIEGSEFQENNAVIGAVLDSISSTITIEASGFQDSNATYWGGVLYSSSSTITIEASGFQDNYANEGGVLYSRSSTITIEGSEFQDNNARSWGGVLYSDSNNTITIEASEFHDNYASLGGVLDSFASSTITIEGSGFHGNNATDRGGVLYSYSNNNITIAGSNFTNNISPIGAIIYATSRSMIQHIHGFLLVDNNKADRYAVIYLSDSEFIGNSSENATFSNNLGSLMAFNSNITFTGYATFVNNTPSQTVSGDFQEGGAITLLQSNVFIDGVCNLEHNHAENGGAIHSTESKLYVNGDITIAHNTATGNGGGVYLSTSELNCQQKSTLVLLKNIASHKGGGLHAIGSSIKAASSSTYSRYTGVRINITGNTAERGGGLSLEANAKLYILKYNYIFIYDIGDFNTTTFTANSADYGGAIHVDDDTNSGTCASSTETECFFQILSLALYNFDLEGLRTDIWTQSMHFSQNHASISGSTLYGGLLDRCAVSPFADVHNKYLHAFKDRGGGIAYFKNVSIPTYRVYLRGFMQITIDTNLSVSSDPVRVCLCFNADQNNDCTHQHYTQ